MEAQAIYLLEPAGSVCLPAAVERELKDLLAAVPGSRPEWILTEPLTEPYSDMARGWQDVGFLDAGEAEAIALALQEKADWLLTDDAAARLFASVCGLESHGSLAIPLWAAAAGNLDRAEAEEVLYRLAQSSLWLSPTILAEARAALAEIFR